MKRKRKSVGMLNAVLLGILSGVLMAVGFAMLFALLCEKGVIPEDKILFTVLISLLISVFLSTVSAGSRVTKMKFPTALCVGGGELLICILMHTLLLQGQFYHMIWLGVIFVLATVTGGLLAVKNKGKRKFA